MTDAPDIIIHRAHDRVCLAEIAHESGVELFVAQKEEIKQRTDPFLVFEDEETALIWIALRAKELSSEGVEVCCVSRYYELRKFPDKRVTVPLRNHPRPRLRSSSGRIR